LEEEGRIAAQSQSVHVTIATTTPTIQTANLPSARHNPSSLNSTSSSSTPIAFTSTTNSDGRVTSWTPSSSAPFTAPADLETLFKEDGDQKYSLTFNTEEYFGQKGVKTFFPEVEVKFVVRREAKGEHYHVPVLLGPFGYTTYRGS
jgi:5-hydroxyisourate hydrolase